MYRLVPAVVIPSAILVGGCGPKAVVTRPPEIQGNDDLPQAATVYDVRISSSAVPRDGEGTVSFEALPIRPWHVNLAYPTRVELKASPGLGVEDRTHTKTDARIMERGGIRFLIPVEGAQPGTHKLTGRFLFAMCSDGEDCVAVKHDFDLDVSVE